MAVRRTAPRSKPTRARRAPVEGGGRAWSRWLVGRIAQAIPVVVGVLLLTFLLIHLVPGDPVLNILGVHATPRSVAALRDQLNLDRPLLEQLWLFVSGAFHGDLGESLVQQGRPVTSIVLESTGTTLFLTAVAVLMAAILGTALGLVSALTQRAGIDVAIRSVMIVLLATPAFLVGYVLLLVVALRLGLAPAGGWGSGFPDHLRYVWLPGLALASFLTPIIARAVRQSARETNEQQFIEAALARGLSRRAIVLRHVLPNSLLPVITLIGVNIGGLIGGAVVIEAVFDLPGTGSVLVRAVESRDYPVVQGAALVTAVLVVVITILTDAITLALDPRARHRR